VAILRSDVDNCLDEFLINNAVSGISLGKILEFINIVPARIQIIV
jgi:hypothetical protein